MLAFVSLWSADLLALGEAIDLVDAAVDGYHIDVFDGHQVPELLFGPDLVSALRARTSKPIEAHLTVRDPRMWAARFLDAGADVITVHSGPVTDVRATLDWIRDHGGVASLGLELHESVHRVAGFFDHIDRLLVMGTATGVKGAGLDPGTAARIRNLVEQRGARRRVGSLPIIVDGGIRPHTVPILAAAGADGVVPGSLVFGSADPVAAIESLHGLSVAALGHTD